MKKIYTIILILLFAAGAFYTTVNWRQYHTILTIGSMAMVILIGILKKTYIFNVDKKTLGLFIIYTIISIISGVIHGSVELVGGALLLLYLYLSLVIVLPEIITDKLNFRDIMSTALLLSHIPMIIFPIILGGFETTSYSGMFYNPNSFGTVVVTLSIIPLSKITFQLDRYFSSKSVNWNGLIKNLLFFLIIGTLVLFSSSRTSFLSLLLLIILSVFVLTKRNLKIRKVKVFFISKLLGIIMVVITLFIILYNFTSIGAIFHESILDKFVLKSDDVLDGRSGIWSLAINDMRAFGHGRDYFSNSGLAAHNTFISILGQYGYLPLFFFISFYLRVFFKAIKSSMSEYENEYKYLPLLGISIFLLLSMAEGMMLKTSMFIAFICVGFLRNRDTMSKT